MQVTTSAMAEELEKKVQSLVEGYEQLETISSKVFVDTLVVVIWSLVVLPIYLLTHPLILVVY